MRKRIPIATVTSIVISVMIGAVIWFALRGDRALERRPVGEQSGALASLRAELDREEERNLGLLTRLRELRSEQQEGTALPDPESVELLPRDRGKLVVVLEGPGGQPVADRRITIRREPSGGRSPFLPRTESTTIKVTTNQSGRAGFPDLEPGEYLVTHRFPGGYRSTRVGVGPGEPVTLEVRSPVGITVRGTVAEFEGGPVKSANIVLWNGELTYEGSTDAEGRFELTNVVPGAYRSVVRGSLPDPYSVFRDVEIPAGEPPRLQLLTRVPTLHGTLRDANTGHPVSGARIRFVGQKSTASDADGNWRLLDLYPAGTTELVVEKEGYVTKRIPGVSAGPGIAKGVEIRLEVRER